MSKKNAMQVCVGILELFGDMDSETKGYLGKLILASRVQESSLARCGLVADLLKEGGGKMDLLAFLKHELPAGAERLNIKIEPGKLGPDLKTVTLTMKDTEGCGYVELTLDKHMHNLSSCEDYIWVIQRYNALCFGGPVASWGFYDRVGENGELEDYCFPVVICDGDVTAVAEIYLSGLEFLVKALRSLCNEKLVAQKG